MFFKIVIVVTQILLVSGLVILIGAMVGDALSSDR